MTAATRAERDDARPDRYAVVGHPVAHSRSPAIHARFAAQTGQALKYGRLDLPPDDFAARLRAWEKGSEAGFGPVRGCNVTVPFKFAALELADRRSARAALAEAANVLSFDGTDGWHADNTDGVGLVRDIVVHAGVRLAGARVLLIGAGGAAAGVLGPVIDAGPAAVHVVNRTTERAAALVARHAALGEEHGVALSAGGLDAAGVGHDIVVNASASSLHGAGSPVAASVLRPGTLALDLMYGPAAAPFLAWAAAHGAVPRDGLGMLVEQAAAAFFLWRGVAPRTDDVLADLRAGVASA